MRVRSLALGLLLGALVVGCASAAVPPYAIPPTMSVVVSGGGRVVGGEINCPHTCSQTFSIPAMLTLTPRPDRGHYFAGWGGACWGERSCLVAMNSPQSAQAQFIALPNTAIRGHRLSRTALIVSFAATGGAGHAVFACRLDHGRYRTCVSPLRLNGVPAGRHVLSVRATDSNSRVDRSPATLRFTVH